MVLLRVGTRKRCVGDSVLVSLASTDKSESCGVRHGDLDAKKP